MVETGEVERRLTAGFFRHLWEAYYELDFCSMNLAQLNAKRRMLEDQLAKVKAEKEAKLRPLMLAFPTLLEMPKLGRFHSDSTCSAPLRPMSFVPTLPTNPSEVELSRAKSG